MERSLLRECSPFASAPHSQPDHKPNLARIAPLLPHEVSRAEEASVERNPRVGTKFAANVVTEAQSVFNVVQPSARSEALDPLSSDAGFKAGLNNPPLRDVEIFG